MVLFDDTNYLGWSRQVSMALGAKLNLDFINGTISRLEAG